MKIGIVTTVAVLGRVFSMPPIASAHHSFCATYDPNKPFSFQGKVVRIEYGNPHVYLHLDVKDDKGSVKQWMLHAAPANRLAAAGGKADTLKVGDEVLARGFLSKVSNDPYGALGELVFKGKTLWAGEARIC